MCDVRASPLAWGETGVSLAKTKEVGKETPTGKAKEQKSGNTEMIPCLLKSQTISRAAEFRGLSCAMGTLGK